MKNITYLFSLIFLFTTTMFSQEYIMVVQKPYVVSLDVETGDVIDSQAIDMTALNTSTPKAVKQIGDEIWVTDQISDLIYRFDEDGNHLGNISGGIDNIKGLDLIDNSEVWVTNAGTANGAPGDAIVRFDMNGNNLGFYPTGSNSSFDVLDVGNGEVFISFISEGSPIERWDYNGNFINNVVEPNNLNFAQQVDITASGNLLVGNFSSPSGVYVFDVDTGDQIEYWSQTGVRGVMETGDGSILWSNSAGVHRLDPTTGSSTLLLGGASQFFGRVNFGEGCTTPTLSVETPDPICEGTTATIEATSNGEDIHWYDTESGTTPIFTGSSFTTPELSETTSYWVQAFSYGDGEEVEIEGGARVAPTNNTGSSVVAATSPWGLSFDVDEDFTINSVDVYLTGSAGTLVVQLLDENWNFIEETTVSCPAGNASNPVQHEVSLDFDVQAGNTYRLVAVSSPQMVREFTSAHPGFPYPIGDVGTVTGGTINSSHTNNTVYYFFYNWTVTTMGVEVCESDREEVVVTVNPTPETPSGESDQNFRQGDTLADLEVIATGDLTWYEDENGTVVLPETTELEDGVTYYVSQTIDGCESGLFAITVHLTIGVDSFKEFAMSVYPNPVATTLNIISEKQIDFVEIYDITGRRLARITNVIDGKIDFSMYAAGTYVIRVKAGKEFQAIKILKE